MNGPDQVGRNSRVPKQAPRMNFFQAADGIMNTLGRIAGISEHAFPLFADAQNGQWQLSSGGSWMGGFWCGSWCLRAKLSGHASDRYIASLILEHLVSKLHTDTIFRSTIFWYGAAPALRLFNDPKARDIVIRAADAISHSYNTRWHCYPVGTALGGGEPGNNTLNIDAFAPLIQVLQFGDDKAKESARCHAEATLRYLSCSSGDFHTNVTLGPSDIEVTGLPGKWARGRSWGLLGLSTAATLWGEPYQALAETYSCQWWEEYADSFPLNRQRENGELYDPSASLIAALAMYKLSSRSSRKANWRGRADHIIRRLIESEHFHFDRDTNEARFTGCCYRNKKGQEILGETVWGYFFLLQALLIAENIIDPEGF